MPSTATGTGSLFDAVVSTCGLSEVFAADSVEQACRKAGFPGSALSPANLPQLVPALQPMLKVFLGREEAARRIERIQALANPRPDGDRR